MSFSIYQISVALFCLGVIVERSIRFFRREHAQSLFKYITVMVIWGSIAIFGLFPVITHWINRKFGLGDNLNTLIFIGFIILFLLFFRLLTIIEEIERTITEHVRKEALRDLHFKKKKSMYS